MQMPKSLCPKFWPFILPEMLLLSLLLTSATARTYPNRQERHIDELTPIDGPSGEPSQISFVFLPEPEDEERRRDSDSGLSAIYNRAADEDDLVDRVENMAFKRNEGNSNRRGQGHAELFTRMRSICAKMPRLKRKRTPKPGSAESLVSFLCSSTNIFRRR